MDESCRINPRLKNHIRIIDGLIVLIILWVAIYSVVNFDAAKEEIASEVFAYGLLGLSIITILLELVPQIINPLFASWAAILAGFNVHMVIFVTILSSLLGSILGFWIGKRFGQRYVCNMFEYKTINKINYFWVKYGKAFVAFSALTPLPYFPIIFGSLNMSWKSFIIYGLIFRVFNFLIFGYLFQFGMIGFLQ